MRSGWTPEAVAARVDDLRALERRDGEAARAGVERLRCEVLQAIADGLVTDPVAVARAAMATVDEEIGGC